MPQQPNLSDVIRNAIANALKVPLDAVKTHSPTRLSRIQIRHPKTRRGSPKTDDDIGRNI